GCAASTGLSRCGKRVRVTAAAFAGATGQGDGDPGAASPDRSAGAAAGQGQAAVPSGRPGVPGRPAEPAPTPLLRRFRLLVRPDAVLRWYRDLLARRHAARSRSKRRAVRAPSPPSACCAASGRLGLPVHHGELLVLGIKTAASTVWDILRQA